MEVATAMKFGTKVA